jgi:hypothetical protein
MRRPICLGGWHLLLLNLSGVAHMNSTVSFHFSWPYKGEEIPGGDHDWRSFILIANPAGFLVFWASSEGFHSHLLCSQNSSLDGGSVMLVLAAIPLAALSLMTTKSCSTSMYTPCRTEHNPPTQHTCEYQEQDRQHNTQQKGTQPTNWNTYCMCIEGTCMLTT